MPLRLVSRFGTTRNPMSNLTNLLPRERRQALSRDFLLRLGVVAVALVTMLVLSAALLLIPTYVFLDTSAETKRAHLATIEKTLSSREEEGLSARLALLSSNTAKLSTLASTPSVSALARAILALPRPGSYTSGAGDAPTTLVLSGSSMTREALRKYQVTLQDVPEVASATLPVSSYADDANIAFAITITLSP
jgi:hypothetical protein